jgi:alkylhydroperoxidase family enzyme
MRLAPIENPRSWTARMAYWYSRRKFGKVLTTLKVLYARKPDLIRPYAALLGSETKLRTLPAELRILLKAKIASINGCQFCIDIARYTATDDATASKIGALDSYTTNPLFNSRERSALAFVEEATNNRKVSDQVFESLRVHFEEGEIVELTWLNALENFLNLTTLSLGIESDNLCEIRK